ncbi:hypothetical protein [Nocardioides sp.]|uniref:hypothetical protein n=1 Tax=Nocardioides sp. TaxID=35761 RepID=UPI001A2A25B7|nr:hypothetical protein [Nocardioides sp.]MBJ7357350.1 hypothetical protein [Nocardioides sp.]
MNTHHDELEQLLGRQLHDQVDHLGGHPLSLGDVTGRAGRIRRNRRIAAGLGSAAAVAIIVPVAVFAGRGVDDADRPIEPAPSPDAPTEVARTTLTLTGLERGDAPGVEYFTPDGVVLPEDGLRRLDPSYQALVPSPADGGWIAVDPPRDSLSYLSEDFQPQGGSSKTAGLATTPDRAWVSWTATEAGAQTLLLHSTTDPEAGMAWDFPELPEVSPVGFVAEDRVVFEATDRKGSVEAGIAEPDGSVTPLPGLVGVMSADPVEGRIALQTTVNDDASGCSGVLDPAVSTTEPIWETCDHSLGAFSPDGRYVMASSPYGDGLGLTRLEILDAGTGELVAEFTQRRSSQIALVMPVWESADAIVAVGVEGETQTLVRLGVDGTLEEVVEPMQGEFGDLYFYFGEDRTRF